MNNQNAPKKNLFTRIKDMYDTSQEKSRIKKADARAGKVMTNQRRELHQELSQMGHSGIVQQRIAQHAALQQSNARADAVTQRQQKETAAELEQMRQTGAGRTGVSSKEKTLSGYLIGRGLTKRPVEGDQLSALRTGNQTVNETRAKLNKGRGNVDIDVDRPGHEDESSRRTKIGRDLAKEKVKDDMTAARKGQVKSSVAELCRAGNCGEHALVATHTHADKLSRDQTVHKVGHKSIDHAWSELRMSPTGTSSDVIIDAWAKGPAVLREDSGFAHDVSRVRSGYSYDRKTGPAAAQQVRQDTALLKGDKATRQHVRTQLKALEQQDYRYPDKSIWAPTPVTSDAFDKQVKAAQKKQGGLRHEIVAAGVARNLGANVKQAAAFADGVVNRKK